MLLTTVLCRAREVWKVREKERDVVCIVKGFSLTLECGRL